MTTSTAPATTTSPATNAVLVLSTRHVANKPMVISFDGEFNLDDNKMILFIIFRLLQR